MTRIYANSIERGARTIDSVPSKLRDEVKALVIADGYEFDEEGYAHKVEYTSNDAGENTDDI